MAILSAVGSAAAAHPFRVSRGSTGISWTGILEIGESAANAVGLKGVNLEDTAMDFVVSITAAPEGSENLSEETLKERAGKFARNALNRLRRDSRRFTSLDETSAYGTTRTRPEPISRELGPEELLQRAELLKRLLEPLWNFSYEQRRLFIGRILQAKRLVDISEETGRSADALSKSLANVIRRLRVMYEQEAISMEQIEYILNQMDRLVFL